MTGVKISPIVSPRIFTKTNVDLKVAASSPTNKGKSDKSQQLAIASINSNDAQIKVPGVEWIESLSKIETEHWESKESVNEQADHDQTQIA